MEYFRLTWCFTLLIILYLNGVCFCATDETLPTRKWKGMDVVKIDRCLPNMFFWRDSNSKEFYACLSKTTHAVRMRCGENKYMCNTGPKAFKPCACDGKPPKAPTTAPMKSANNFAKEGDDNENNSYQNSIYQNYQTATPYPKQEDGSNGKGVRSLSPWKSLPAQGCKHGDLFEKYPMSHMFEGEQQAYATLLHCQEACLNDLHCWGVDWNVMTDSADNKRCYFVYSKSFVYGKESKYDQCCDHYRRTNCLSKPPTTTTEAPENGFQDAGKDSPRSTPNGKENDNGNGNGDNKMNGNNGNDNQGAGGDGPQYYTPVDDTTVEPVTTTTLPQTTTTIPDSGCPYIFTEYPGQSHPFGINVTAKGKKNHDVEGCKYWCLIVGFCKGVDFDYNTNTCYYVREIKQEVVTNVSGVTHFRKNECAPPLKCWYQNGEISDSNQISVVDPNTPQIKCFGVCYVKQTFGKDKSTIERGCDQLVDPTLKPNVGCRVDQDYMSVSCTCDTPRCNGLSVSAMASQMLYLPLDGDLSDHSGTGHNGSVPKGYKEPEFTCLDKAVNCSALFTGAECVSVESLSQTQWGNHDNSSNFIPQATFAVWFKRITTGDESRQQGIFGNSKDKSSPTWRIIAREQNNYVGGGISTEGAKMDDLDDYPHLYAGNDGWHLAVMTYSGIYKKESGQFPILKFFMDGMNMMGNAVSDIGPINVKKQPVTVGCVNEETFVGFIDEARIFNSALDQHDIDALIAMRDVSFL